MKPKVLIFASLIVAAAFMLSATTQQSAEQLYQSGIYKEDVEGKLEEAIAVYRDIVKRFPSERAVAAKALLHIGICYEKLGKTEARNAYNRLLQDYSDQTQPAKEARSRLAQLEAAASAPPAKTAGLTFRKLDVAGAESTNQVRLSPDGTKMLYIGTEAGQTASGIHVVDLASGKSFLLVEGVEANYMNPAFAWSPDGKKVVFRSGYGELRIVDSTGGKPRDFWSAHDKDADVFPLDWSGQIKAILIALPKSRIGSTSEKGTSLAILSEEGGEPRTVVSGDMSELTDWTLTAWARFSPEGKYIVGMKRKERNTDIYVWAVDDGCETRITDHAANDECPLWSADGSHIIFLSDRAKTPDLWAVPMAGSRPVGDPIRIQSDIGKNKVPTDVTRSGHLLFLGMRSAGQPSDLFVMPVEPKTGEAQGPLRPYARYPTQSSSTRWSPDGSRIAYMSRKGNMQLPNAYVSSGGTEVELEIPAKGFYMVNIEWARDGKSLLFPGWNTDDNRVGIFRVSLESLDIEPVLPLGDIYGPNFKGAYANIRWLPLAGRYMFAKVLGETEEEIYLMDPVDYKVERVGDKFEISGFGSPSPDGRYLVSYNWQEKKVFLLSLPDGASRFLCPLPPEGWPGISWSPDGKKLVWGEGGSLKTLSVPEGTIHTLVEAGPNLSTSGFHEGTPNSAWSPDGTKIAYALQEKTSAGGVRGGLWVVDVASGSARKIADAPSSHPVLQNIAWHPSGKMIFARGSAAKGSTGMYEHWVMENFLPAQPAVQAGAEKGAQEFKMQKVWDAPIYSLDGSPSPDGRYLTYTSEQDFLNLGVYDLAKGESRLLTHHKSWADEEYCYDSIFSPDASRIAYCCQVKGRLIQLRTVNLDGTSTRILRDGKDGLDYIPFGWTSDGKEILTAFFGSDNLCGIAFVSALDGSIKEKKALSLKVPWGEKMHLSPDGKYIAGTYLPRWDSGNKDIFLLAIDGGEEVPVVEHPADDALIGWSPDGGQVLFTSDRTGTIGIWTARVSKGKAVGTPEFIRGNMGIIHAIGMTRNGKLYYGVHTGWSDVFVAPIDPATAAVLAPPTKAVRKYETFNSVPDWSPDGQSLVCQPSRGRPSNESPVLLICSMQTNEIRELTPKTPGGGRFGYYYLRWSPDGRSFLGGGRDEKGQVGALLSVDVQTGEAKVVARADSGVDGQGNILAHDYSPDGKSIYFIRIGNKFRRLCKLDLETGVEKEIGRFPKSGGPFYLALSPDGQQLAFNAEGKIKILSRDGTESRDLPDGHAAMVLDWMPDGKTILYGKPQDGNPDVVEVWRAPVTGGEPQKAGLSMPRLLLLKVSPDGKNVALMATEQPIKSEVWVMENFLPEKK
jgi:Tol biopolymer transport system component